MIDSKDLGTRNGFDLMVTLEYDEICKPSDFDCYSDEQIAAWKQDRWCFVGLVVTASMHGIQLGSASLWGIEAGDMPGVDHWINPLNDIDEDYADFVDEAISNAHDTLRKLIESAAA